MISTPSSIFIGSSPLTKKNLDDAISEIEAKSDVVDVVGTYSDLQSYDTSSLTDQDVIKVLADEGHEGAQTYYRYAKSSDSFSYVGASGPFVPTTTSTNILYGTSNNGAQTTITYSSSATGGTIAYRNSAGQVLVAETPTADAHATSKKYVDTQLSDYQPKLTNQTNIKSINGSSILGSGNLELTQYLGFPESWPTTSSASTKDFCDAVAADDTAIAGKMYLGEVYFSDLSDLNLANAEISVSIMKGSTQSTKVIVLHLTSGNQEPYQWQYVYWNGGSNTSGWVGFQVDLKTLASYDATKTQSLKNVSGTMTWVDD